MMNMMNYMGGWGGAGAIFWITTLLVWGVLLLAIAALWKWLNKK